MEVNCDMDLKPYSKTTIVNDDSDMTLLINKFYALPEGYEPDDLVTIKDYACVQGEDYSCQDVSELTLRKEAYQGFKSFFKKPKRSAMSSLYPPIGVMKIPSNQTVCKNTMQNYLRILVLMWS